MAETAVKCACCKLQHKTVDDNGLCSACRYHQSDEIHQTAKRHSEHEDMLRERLLAASNWATEADGERKKFGEKMHWAYKSRDRTIKVLRQIADIHELHANGECKCRQRKCKIGTLLDDRGIQTLIRRVDQYEDEQRNREQMWREIQATGDYDAWEEFLRNEGNNPRSPGEGRADTA